MKEVVARIELLLFASVLLAACLLIPAVKPVVSIHQAAIQAFDAILRLQDDCSVDVQKFFPEVFAFKQPLDHYKTRLFSQETRAQADEKWQIVRGLPTNLLLDMGAKVQPLWIGYHDAWEGEKFPDCPSYVSQLRQASEELSLAYYYTNSTNPSNTPLVDLDSRFNASIKVPYLDNTFTLSTVLRLVSTIILFAYMYVISLLRSLRRIRKRRDRLEYGSLIFAHPGTAAVVTATAWITAPLAMYVYLIANHVITGMEFVGLVVFIGVTTGWLLFEAYAFRLHVLLPRHQVLREPDQHIAPEVGDDRD